MPLRSSSSIVLLQAILALLFLSGPSGAEEPIIGGPCEGCEIVFIGLPVAVSAHERIAPADEPGDPMVIEGVVRGTDGAPAAGVIVYAHQTNARGVYPPASTPHGRLRGWAKADAQGRYRFDTVRPGAYPSQAIPQHVHMHVIEPGQATYYIDDIVFADDPLLTPARRRSPGRGRGGDGLAQPEKDAAGVWQVRRDIVLRQNVPAG